MVEWDVIIIGAGPAGLACAVECKTSGLKTLILEKGSLVNAIYHFPSQMIFFTTSDLLEIGQVPFTTPNPKPTREEGLNYYKRVAQFHGLTIHTQEKVLGVRRTGDSFEVTSKNATEEMLSYKARFVVIATGYYDNPNRLHIPGEDLPKVSHYYTDAHPYYDKDVLIIGGRNSACIAALELYRYGARVTVVHRKEEIKQSVKYWILPDFLNRVKEGAIKLLTQSVVTAIEPRSVTIHHSLTGSARIVPNDFVFALTGYRPDASFLKDCGLALDDKMVPRHDPATLRTHISGIYVAGSVSAGLETNKLFIENGRFHGKIIAEDILKITRE